MLLCCICFISKGKDCRSQSRKSKSEVIESDPQTESQSDQKVKVHGSRSQSDQKVKINQKQSKSTAVVKVNTSSQSQQKVKVNHRKSQSNQQIRGL